MVRPRFVRYRKFNRLQHSANFLKWLDAVADSLNTTAKFVFEVLLVGRKMTFEQVQQIDALTAPENSSIPVVIGDAVVGAVLYAEPGEWEGVPSPTLSHQWYTTDGDIQTEIEGETDITYDIVEGDVGMMIFVRETATNSEGSDSVDSEPTATVTEPN